MTELEVLTQRLERVERRLRAGKRLGLTFLVFMVVGFAASQAASQGILGLDQIDPLQSLPRPPARENRPVESEIRASHFVLVDEKGIERASLVAGVDSSYLVMFDSAGKPRLSLSLTGAGPNVSLLDPSGQARTVIGSTTLVGSRVAGERSPASSIALFDKGGKLLFRQ